MKTIRQFAARWMKGNKETRCAICSYAIRTQQITNFTDELAGYYSFARANDFREECMALMKVYANNIKYYSNVYGELKEYLR